MPSMSAAGRQLSPARLGSPGLSRLQPPVVKPQVLLYILVLAFCGTIVIYHVMMLPVWGLAQQPGVLNVRRALQATPATPPRQTPVHELSCRQINRMATPHTWKKIPIEENGQLRFSMWAYNSSDIVSSVLETGDAWEAWELAEVRWALGRYKLPPVNTSGQQPPVFVDVGANIGWYTLAMAFRNYTVVAFEGMRENALMIARSMCGAPPGLTQRITLVHGGLGAAPGSCYIYSHATNLGDGNTLCGQHTLEAAAQLIPAGYEIRETMAVSRLDDALLAHFPSQTPLPPLLLKMDVEGFEFEILKGAVQLLARGAFHYILAERDPGMMTGASGPDAPRDFLYFLLGFGYALADKSFEGPFVPHERVAEVAAKWGAKQKNLYFVHKHAPTAKHMRFYKHDEI